MAIIDKSNDFFNTLLYSGNNTNNTSITGVGFEPDLTWIKNRNSSGNNCLFTQIAGLDVAGYISTNNNSAFASDATLFKSFNSNGFTVGTGGNVNDSGRTYCSWNWKAGTSFSNSAGANGASIASTGNINTTSGFSIIKWTGSGANATIAHGLGSTPKAILVKNTSGTGNWKMWQKTFATSSGGNATSSLNLNDQSAFANTAAVFNSMATINDNVFSVGAEGDTNENNSTMIAYCFAEKQGYSKFSSYIGNGNANGTFVYTGFKPAWILVKIVTASNENWMLLDNKRDGFNDTNEQLFPNTNDDEEGNDELDILSNGFKLRRNNSRMNGSGGTYIYWAFAENPLVASNFNAATAR